MKKTTITLEKKEFVIELINRIAVCYDSRGATIDDYYENVILNPLSVRENEILKEICDYNLD